MDYAGFCGPAYRTRSLAASGDLAQNLFAEPIETGKGAGQTPLYGTPGLLLFDTLPDSPVRGFTTLNDRTWAVAGQNLYELHDNGTHTALGVLVGGGGTDPAQLMTDGKTVVIAANGKGFALDVGTSAITPINPGNLPGAGTLGYIDGFFMASVPTTADFQISALNDGETWRASNFGRKNGAPDNLVGLAAMRRQAWLLGTQTGEVWWNTGNTNFPFERLQGVFLEVGLAAPQSMAIMDETLFWLGSSKRGTRSVYRSAGYQEKRISTFALEYAMSQYAAVSDAVGFVYEEGGHAFYVLTFPSARINAVTGVKTSATWAMDLATNWWHERAWLNPILGTQEGVRGWVHTYAFDRHLVGDRESGKIYQQAQGFYTDAGQPIKRVRRAPILTFEDKETFFHRLELLLQVGVVPQEPAQGSLPLFNLRMSGDSGYTFGPEIEVQGGAVGNYNARVFWGPLGAARRAVFEISSSEPIEHCWIAAYFEATAGIS
jgi:hypothetical protein